MKPNWLVVSALSVFALAIVIGVAQQSLVYINGTSLQASPSSFNLFNTLFGTSTTTSTTTNTLTTIGSGSGLTLNPITTGTSTSASIILSPTSGLSGSTVTIIGTGFTPTNNTVHFGTGDIANIPSADGKTLSFTVPTGTLYSACAFSTPPCMGPWQSVTAGASYNVSVTNSSTLGSANSVAFTVTSTSTAPTFTLSATSGPLYYPNLSITSNSDFRFTKSVDKYSIRFGGSLMRYLTISGDKKSISLLKVPTVLPPDCAFGNTPCTDPSLWNKVIPGNTYNVQVFDGSSALSDPLPFTVSNNMATTSFSLSPSSGPVGTVVTVTGTGFYPLPIGDSDNVNFGNGTVSWVSYAGVSDRIKIISPTQLTFIVPDKIAPPCWFLIPICRPFVVYKPYTIENTQNLPNVVPNTYNVSITNSKYPVANNLQFAVTAQTPFSIFPTSGPSGTVITITSPNLSPTGNTLHFGNLTYQNLSSPDGVTLSFTVPPNILSAPGIGIGSTIHDIYNISVTNANSVLTSTVIPSFTLKGADPHTNLDGSYTLTWDAVPEAVIYAIYRNNFLLTEVSNTKYIESAGTLMPGATYSYAFIPIFDSTIVPAEEIDPITFQPIVSAVSKSVFATIIDSVYNVVRGTIMAAVGSTQTTETIKPQTATIATPYSRPDGVSSDRVLTNETWVNDGDGGTVVLMVNNIPPPVVKDGGYTVDHNFPDAPKTITLNDGNKTITLTLMPRKYQQQFELPLYKATGLEPGSVHTLTNGKGSSIKVNASKKEPIGVNLLVNGKKVAVVKYGDTAILSWSSNNPKAVCTADSSDDNDFFDTGGKANGSLSIGPILKENVSYSISCTDSFGNVDGSMAFVWAPVDLEAAIGADPNPVSYKGSTTLSWGSSMRQGAPIFRYVTKCVGTGFDTGDKTSGSLIVGPLTVDTKYTVSCSDSNQGYYVASTTVKVLQPMYLDLQMQYWCSDHTTTGVGANYHNAPSGQGIPWEILQYLNGACIYATSIEWDGKTFPYSPPPTYTCPCNNS